MKIQIQLYIASALLLALPGCATAPAEQIDASEPDLSKSLPPTAAGIPSAPLYFASVQDAEKALAGYNYGLVNLPDGRIQAFISGLVGSGVDNPITPGQAPSQSGGGATQLAQNDTEMPFPLIMLEQKKNGQAAIDALGDKIGEVAKSYDMSPERLEEILRTDSSAWIDETGHLLYIDTHTQTPPDQVQEATATVAGGSSFSEISNMSNPFALHSKAGSNRIIYLDFNGHTASSTAWNSGTLTAQAYDIDNNPSVFSQTEQNNIKLIWQRVAEDYAPFDVDVTTQEPSASALQRTSSTDTQYGTRAVITRSMPQLCSQSCGGVAYVNVFSYYSSSNPNRYQPAWVFFDKLGNGYPKYVAEAVSHEVGHNLNLIHDGNKSTAYYTGHGSGNTGWAPIMGVGYYKPVTQWSKGEYPGANNPQDDVAVIHAAGAALRPDDYANVIAGASPLGGNANAVNQIGIIERNSDIDIFAFATAGGRAQFNASPDPVAPNLDVLLTLLNAQGNAIAQANPSDSLSASLDVSLASGQYFLKVEGIGKGDLTTGYSDYGSLGQYQITGSYVPGQTASSPAAVISASPALGDAPLKVTFDGRGSRDNDGSITTYGWNFGDGATLSGNSVVSHTYQTAGTYTATLTVTDNSGLTGGASHAIQVTQSPVTSSMQSSSVKVSRKIVKSRSQCIASVTVKYGDSPVSSAMVSGEWSGSVKIGKQSVIYKAKTKNKTGNAGVTNLAGPLLLNTAHGTCAFTVTDVSKRDYTYQGNGNVSASFTW